MAVVAGWEAAAGWATAGARWGAVSAAVFRSASLGKVWPDVQETPIAADSDTAR